MPGLFGSQAPRPSPNQSQGSDPLSVLPIVNSITSAYRNAVPANYRLFLSTMMGDRSPVTEGNFSPAELARLQQIVASDQRQLPQRAAMNARMIPVWQQTAAEQQQNLQAVRKLGRNLTEDEAFKYGVEYTPGQPVGYANAMNQLGESVQHAQQQGQSAANVARRASHGVGAVRYDSPDQMSQMQASGYPMARSMQDAVRNPQVQVGPFTMGVDYGDRNTNALANTIGQFVYQPTPNGGTKIDDNYSWQSFNDQNGRSDLPTMFGQLVHGNVEPIISSIMPGRGSGRPVHITLPPVPR